ncbi:Serine hydrolase FSH [Penicillium cf. griseofulvum]|uniref:Serine hydrolase FSH n=1 Tax=Penicillium cf. griseofulvum TaxID=2972120 RepID=A0A9W9MQ45_9EURO|nr:Serine hydrolase FSH [Penicillium cf. griseofulvum]KAJ5437420.1 Serine hydrolase FSH [Penicillium cf. griseofulvum]KAJ5441567.1 Serine hydrolase FSH [Penicillium cf. griseofulvum]
MPIRVLCLHGMGTNAAILRAQLQPIMDLLSATECDFMFPDAPWTCDPFPGVADIHEGPYLAWIRTPSTEQIADAHTYLRKYLSDPIDLVIGFSQGAALAASLMLHNELAGQPSPFKAAMLICSTLPSTCSPEYGIDVRDYFGITGPPTERPRVLPDESLVVRHEYFLRTEATRDADRPVYYNLFHADVDTVRIRIPTAHIYGRRDLLWRQQSLAMIQLCGGKVYRFEHAGGHEVPRSQAEEMCDLIEELVHAGREG